MRIDGKRASTYTNEQIELMLISGYSWDHYKELTEAQKKELRKTLRLRKEKS